MKKDIIKHITVEGFASNSDLSNCEILEKELNEAKAKLKLAKKDVKVAKGKLNLALEEVISNIENKKKGIKETQNNLSDDSDSTSVLNSENLKSKLEESLVDLELKKDEIKKKIGEYEEDGSENWETFKHELNHDLEELGTALKSFATKTK
jgi:hypothetical protein